MTSSFFSSLFSPEMPARNTWVRRDPPCASTGCVAAGTWVAQRLSELADVPAAAVAPAPGARPPRAARREAD